jgi:hypothetical protein
MPIQKIINQNNQVFNFNFLGSFLSPGLFTIYLSPITKKTNQHKILEFDVYLSFQEKNIFNSQKNNFLNFLIQKCTLDNITNVHRMFFYTKSTKVHKTEDHMYNFMTA